MALRSLAAHLITFPYQCITLAPVRLMTSSYDRKVELQISVYHSSRDSLLSTLIIRLLDNLSQNGGHEIGVNVLNDSGLLRSSRSSKFH